MHPHKRLSRVQLEREAMAAKDQRMYQLICSACTNAEDTCSEEALRYRDNPEAYEAKYEEIFWASLECLLSERENQRITRLVKWFDRRGVVA